MAFDVNKIIMESLSDNIEKGNGGEDMNVTNALKGVMVESEESTEHSQAAKKSMREKIEDVAGAAKEKVGHLAGKAREAAEEMAEKAKNADADHPHAKYAAGAALAAGLGALALRKRMAKIRKK